MPVCPKENGKLIFKLVQGNVDGKNLIVDSVEKRLGRISRVGFEVIDITEIFF